MTLQRRLTKLEARGSAALDGPRMIYLCAAPDGGPMGAVLRGGQTLARADDETEAAFDLRAKAVAGDMQAAQEHVLATLARKHNGGGDDA